MRCDSVNKVSPVCRLYICAMYLDKDPYHQVNWASNLMSLLQLILDWLPSVAHSLSQYIPEETDISWSEYIIAA